MSCLVKKPIHKNLDSTFAGKIDSSEHEVMDHREDDGREVYSDSGSLFDKDRKGLSDNNDSFACAVCGSSFVTEADLAEHAIRCRSSRSPGGASGRKSHQCEECGKGFPVRSMLVRHMSHSGARPHSALSAANHSVKKHTSRITCRCILE